MSTNRAKRKRISPKAKHSGNVRPADNVTAELPDDGKKQMRFELLLIAILLVFGAYQSVIYFGHQVVPNSDFSSFADTARPLLSFKLPGSLKRVPGLGLLQIGLAQLVGGNHPLLTAGWLLNAILNPLNLVLLYLVGKEFLGRSAVWFALVAGVNPWVLSMLVEPLVETTLVFLILLTFLFILRRSSWCYLFAAMATMIRQEGAALILAAFVVDVVYSWTWRQRGIVLAKAGAAAVPLGLWMLATFMRHEVSSGKGSYLNYYGHGTVVGEYVYLLWRGAFDTLVVLPDEARAMFDRLMTQREADSIQAAVGQAAVVSRIVVAAGLIASVVFGWLKRRRAFIAVIMFFVPFFLIHTLKSATLQRYCVPALWLVLLMCIFGLKSLWQFISGKAKMPIAVAVILQILVIMIAVSWIGGLLPNMGKLSSISTDSMSLPYVLMGAVAAVLLADIVSLRKKQLLTSLTIAVVVCLAGVSNQFTLAGVMGNGDRDAEFRKLADWYVDNAKPAEKIVTTMPQLAKIFAPEYASSFYPVWRIEGEDFAGFTSDCMQKRITYLAWDSRLGLATGDSYYLKYGLSRIQTLRAGRDTGPWKFVTRIAQSQMRYINIYRLQSPADSSATKNNN
jgi:hypothetical protein